MKNYNISVMLRDERFLGVRLWAVASVLAAIAFFVFGYGYESVGIVIFISGWVLAFVGFWIHFSRWRKN